jgi:predicted transcriptional regulator
MKPATTAINKPRAARRQGVYIRMSENLTRSVRELAAARRVPLQAIFEAALSAYLSPGAQDQRDAMLSRQLNRFSRGVESVDWNTKLLVAMLRYQIELDLSFLPEPVTDEERKLVTEKGARRFDRFEQWLMRHLVDSESLYSRLQGRVTPTDEDFEKSF